MKACSLSNQSVQWRTLECGTHVRSTTHHSRQPILAPMEAEIVQCDAVKGVTNCAVNSAPWRTVNAGATPQIPALLNKPASNAARRDYFVRRREPSDAVETLRQHPYAVSACQQAAEQAVATGRITADELMQFDERVVLLVPALALTNMLVHLWKSCVPGTKLWMRMEGLVATEALKAAHDEALDFACSGENYADILADALRAHLAGSTLAPPQSLTARLAAGISGTLLSSRKTVADVLYWALPDAGAWVRFDASQGASPASRRKDSASAR